MLYLLYAGIAVPSGVHVQQSQKKRQESLL